MSSAAEITPQQEKEEAIRRGRAIGRVIGLILVLPSYAGGFILYQLVLRHTSVTVQLLLTTLYVVPVPIGIYFLFAHATGRKPAVPQFLPSWYREGYENRIQQVLIGVGYQTVAFVSLTAFLLYHHSGISAAGGSADGAGLTYTTLELYAWSVVNAVPTLNLTEIFAWTPALHMTNDLGRLMILAFKLMLIIPLFQVLGKILARWMWHSSAEVQ
jgi:hypothetical protein